MVPDQVVPRLLPTSQAVNRFVDVDIFLPGCPPSADTLWAALVALLTDQPLALPYPLIKYD